MYLYKMDERNVEFVFEAYTNVSTIHLKLIYQIGLPYLDVYGDINLVGHIIKSNKALLIEDLIKYQKYLSPLCQSKNGCFFCYVFPF